LFTQSKPLLSLKHSFDRHFRLRAGSTVATTIGSTLFRDTIQFSRTVRDVTRNQAEEQIKNGLY